MITYNETYEIVTPESAEFGDAEDRGFIDENIQSDFRDMVDLLEFSEFSGSDWFTVYLGVTDYTTAEEESRSYHPKTDRDFRYMMKAWSVNN